MSHDLKQATGTAAEPAGATSDADLDLPIQGFKGTPDEIERQWFEKIYTGRGDSQKQLTLRAVLMGGVLGMFMSISNLYTTLKLGWLFGVAITACVLSYVIWNALRALSGGKLSQMSILENNCMQSTASAAGYSTGNTIATAFGALLLIEGMHRPWYIVAPFTLFTAALGVFVAVEGVEILGGRAVGFVQAVDRVAVERIRDGLAGADRFLEMQRRDVIVVVVAAAAVAGHIVHPGEFLHGGQS